MLYNEACGEQLSRLGFGCMRLPLKEDKSIDEAELQKYKIIASNIKKKTRLEQTGQPEQKGFLNYMR